MRVVANVLGPGRDANGSFAARIGEAPGQDLTACGIAEADMVVRGKLVWSGRRAARLQIGGRGASDPGKRAKPPRLVAGRAVERPRADRDVDAFRREIENLVAELTSISISGRSRRNVGSRGRMQARANEAGAVTRTRPPSSRATSPSADWTRARLSASARPSVISLSPSAVSAKEWVERCKSRNPWAFSKRATALDIAEVVVPARRAASAKEPASTTRTKARRRERSGGKVGVDMEST